MLEAPLLLSVLDQLSLPLLLLSSGRAVYRNSAAARLEARLKTEHGTDLNVLVSHHLETLGPVEGSVVVSLVTAANGEPFYVHVTRVTGGTGHHIMVTVRELAPDREAFRRRYGLSDREAEVVDLVLRGYGNRDIAATLGIAPATAKKHLGSIFNKVGVDSRTQLMSKLA